MPAPTPAAASSSSSMATLSACSVRDVPTAPLLVT
jgi:hypothetical protein